MAEQVVLIAGASGGIGAACVDVFRREAWTVVGAARTLQDVVDATYMGVKADLTTDAGAKRVCDATLARYGRIDAVVHSIGDIYEPHSIAELPWSRWQATFDVCLGSAVHLVRHSYPAVSACAGSYVFVASVAAQHPYSGIADYCAAKAALVTFSRSLAAELAPVRGRSNTVSPAVVDTPLFRKSPYTVEEAAAWHKLGRVGQPIEIAELIHHLASVKSAWITGRDFVIDGGMLL